MKKILFIAACIAAIVSAQGCKFISFNGKSVRSAIETVKSDLKRDSDNQLKDTMSFNVLTFNKIVFEGGYTAEYEVGDPHVEIIAPKSVAEHLVVKAEDGTLLLSADNVNKVFKRGIQATVRISSPDLVGLSVRGAIDFKTEEIKSIKDFKVNIEGAADMDIDRMSVIGDVEFTVDGAGNIEIDNMTCNAFKTVINGAGNVEVDGVASLADLTINGAGSIDVRRLNCPDIKSHRNGLGSIRR